MKKATIAHALALTALLTLVLMSCSAGHPKTDPLDASPPTPAEQVYNFSGIETPPGFAEMAGFENCQWGDTIENVLKKESENGKSAGTLRLVDYSASVAGLRFSAEFLFHSDETTGTKLVSGAYYRDMYIDAFDPLSGMKQAIDDYNLVLAYLTQLYGAPWQSFLDIDGSSHVDVTDNINDFLELRAREAAAIWTLPQSGGSKPCLYLSLSSNGRLYINFISDLIWEKQDNIFADQVKGIR